MKTKLILFFAFVLLVSNLCSQTSTNSIIQNKSKLSKIATIESTTDWLTIKPNVVIKSNKFFSDYKETIGFSSNHNFVLVKSDTDNLGVTHDRFEQYYKGIKVDGEMYILHSKAGNVIRANGKKRAELDMDIVPTISESAALITAFNSVNSQKYAWQDTNQVNIWVHNQNKKIENLYPKGELVIVYNNNGFPQIKNEYTLVWKFEIRTANISDSRIVYIDANTNVELKSLPLASPSFPTSAQKIHGTNQALNTFNKPEPNTSNVYSNTNNTKTDNLLIANSNLTTGDCIQTTGETIWHGNQSINTSYSILNLGYILNENCNNHGDIHTVNYYIAWNAEYSDVDNIWTTNNKEGVEAHKNARMTLDFFYNYFNRSSFDNAGSKINIYNEDPNPINNQDNNAHWDGSNGVYLGNGGTSDANDDFCTIDIVAHEITHGITQNTAGLIYSGESGALNESFSDIFGTAVERYYLGDCCFDWLIGEDRTGGAIRSMSNPKLYNQPNMYSGKNWYTGSLDYGGVHINSGVLNYWFYLLAHGDSGTNDNGYPYNITGIGFNDAVSIAYKTLTYLTPSSVYGDAKIASLQAAIDLFGNNSKQYNAVEAAWCAVGLGTNCQTPTCALTGLTPTLISGTSTSPGQTLTTVTPTLTWSPVAGAANYGVYIKDVATNTLVLSEKCASSTTSYIVPSGLLSNGGQYKWNIIATLDCDNSCISNYSAVYYFNIQSATLNPPRNLSATASDGQVTLSWSAPVSGTPTGYKVYISTSQNGTYTATSTTLSTTTKTYTELTNNSTYWFYVEAIYSTGASATSKISAIPIASSTLTYDEPCNADLLTVGSTCNYVTRTIIGATKSTQIPDATCDQPSNVDVWFKFTIPNGVFSIHTNSISISSNDCGFAIYTGSCSSLTQRFCTNGGNPSQIYMPWVDNLDLTAYAGQTAYIRVWEYGTVSQTGDFQICVSSESSSSGDCNITSLSSSSETHGSSSFSTTPGADDIIVNGQPNCTFTVSESCSWLTVSPMSGKMNSNTTGTVGQVFLNYSIQSNNTGNTRVCTFYINGSPITITQNAEEVDDDDFYISNVNVPSTSIGVNGKVSVSCEQCYSGSKSDSELGPTNLGYYLSKNASFDSNDILLAYEVSNLGDDEPCNSESESLTIPGNTIPGLYYILFVADYDKLYNESNENNNIEAIQITVNSASHDFYILNEAVYPDKFLATELITFKCDLCYSGSSLDAEIGSCHLGYYLSNDKSFNSSTDTYIGAFITSMGSDDPIKNLSYTQANIPTGTSPGNYYILLVADDDNRFVETNESNNVKFVPITVVSGSSGEDFYIQDFSINLSSVVAGGAIDVTCTQCYIGSSLDANIGSSYMGYYLSTNTSFSSTDDIRLGTDGSSLGSDYPYESESATLTIPEGTASGIYYIIFVADYDNRFAETNENNNSCYAVINVKNVTSIYDIQANEQIKIYPNPTTGKFVISEIETLGNKFKVDVIDFLGKIIYTSTYSDFGNKISLDLSTYPNGLYLIRLSNNETSYLKKVIKD